MYAIGDVHGCLRELNVILELIEEDIGTRPIDECKLIFLGDYVDRGPDNFGTLDRLVKLKYGNNLPCIFIMGNHDERLLSFMNNPEIVGEEITLWGGDATLKDYGVSTRWFKRFNSASAAEMLNKTMPKAHREFLEGLEPYHIQDDFFFCHAGVRPGVPLVNQSAHDLMWIRADFLKHQEAFEKVVVHGHTPNSTPEVKSNRINVDTHCYDTGTLTALVLEGNSRRFLAT